MSVFISYLGILGAVLCILAYFLLERGIFDAHSLRYYAVNGLGAFLVLVAVLYSFDSGDMGAILQELCWVAISVMGVLKVRNKRTGSVG